MSSHHQNPSFPADEPSVYGTCLCWYNVLNATISSILSAAPYDFSSGLVGTAYVAPLIGALLAAIWSGWLTDRFAIRLARRNNGVREPEHRLWALAVSAVLCSAGLVLWGVGAARGVHWSGLMFGLGMISFSVVAGGSITLSYAVDCFKVCHVSFLHALPCPWQTVLPACR